MTYVIEQLNCTSSAWFPIARFEDKELADKELRNLNRAWVASGTFRLIKSTTPD